ncbi:hypothetical protein KAR91_08520, partial [Candidatus Pacearchaeota archaeon]|nr:hypothetical protein [Candidatus Pacearchaeota archaeon]
MRNLYFAIAFLFLIFTGQAHASTEIFSTTFLNDRDIENIWFKDAQHATLYSVDETGLIIDASSLTTLATPSGALTCNTFDKAYGALASGDTIYYKYSWVTFGGQESAASIEYSCAVGGGSNNTIELADIVWPSDANIYAAAFYMSNDTGGSPNAYNYTDFMLREQNSTFFIPQEAYGSFASPEDTVIAPSATAAGDSLTAAPSNLEVKDGQVDIDFIVASGSTEVEFAVRVPVVSSQVSTLMSRFYTGLKVVFTSGTTATLTETIENTVHYSPAACTDADCAAYDDGAEHTIRFDFNGTSLDVYIDNMVTPKWTTASLQTQTETNQTGYITMRAEAVKLTVSQITVAEDEDEWANIYEYWNCNQRPVTFTYHGIQDTTLASYIPLQMFRDDIALAKEGGFNPVTRRDVLNWLDDCTVNYLPENPIMYRHDDSFSGNVLTAMAPSAASAGISGVSVGTDQYRVGTILNEITAADLDSWAEMGLFLHWDFEVGAEEEAVETGGYMGNSFNFINSAIDADIHDQYYGMGAITLDSYDWPVYPVGGSMNFISMRPDTLTLAA